MTEQNLQRGVRAILVVATATLVGVLGQGVIQGELRGEPGQFYGSRALFDAGVEHGLLVLTDDARRLLTVSAPEGQVNGNVQLPGRAATIVPTPGGVSVWVTFEDRPEIEIYSTTDLSHEATVLPEGGDGETPVNLTFSENGDTLIVTWQESERISIYGHQMRELTLMREVSASDAAGTVGPVIRNRRATRLYRVETNGNLAAFFAQNGQRLDSIEIPGGGLQPSAPPVFTADYTAAWALTKAGGLVGINEADETAYLSGMDFDPAPGHAPVVVGEEPLGLVIRSDGRGMHGGSLSDVRNLVEFGRDELAAIAVEGRIISAVAAGNGAALLLTTNGRLLTIDGHSLAVVETAEIRDEAGPIRPVSSVPWSIKEDGNFACF